MSPFRLLREASEADSTLVKVEGSVDVLHEAITQEPDVAAETEVLSGKSADTLRRTILSWTEVHAGEKESKY
jgi:hypothetical protein